VLLLLQLRLQLRLQLLRQLRLQLCVSKLASTITGLDVDIDEDVLLGIERFVNTIADVGLERRDLYVSHVVSVSAERFGSYM